jgi:hypothetical protein
MIVWLTTGRMQFSIHFYNSEFSIPLLRLTFIYRIVLRFLIPRGLSATKNNM